jgi:hypothetical protein
MASKKTMRAGRSRHQSGERATVDRSRAGIGQFERLESRELLSTFQPLSTSVVWGVVGGRASANTLVRFDAAGNCLGTSGPEANLHPDCSLGGGTTDPARIDVTFNGTIDKRSVNLANITITGDVDPTNPFHVDRAGVRKGMLSLFTTGTFAEDANSEITLSISGLRAKGKKGGTGPMLPWSSTYGTAGDSQPGGPPGNGQPDTVRPTVLGTTPASGSVSNQSTSFVEALFSEDLQPSSVSNPANFQLIGRGADGAFGTADDSSHSPSAITYSQVSDSARWTFNSPLPNGTYRARLAPGMLDVAGNPLVDFTATFTLNVSSPVVPPVQSPGDITPPYVVQVTPGVEASVSTPPNFIVAQFSESIDPASVNADTFQVVASGNAQFGDGDDRLVSVSSVHYDAGSRQAFLFVNERLAEDVYRIHLSGRLDAAAPGTGPIRGIRDLSGNALDGNRDGYAGGDYRTEFQVDPTPPSVILDLAPTSDSGAAHDRLTSGVSQLAISGRVIDGNSNRLAGFTVALDVNGDGQFDDGAGVTDHRGAFSVPATGRLQGRHAQTVGVQVTDLAGNVTVQSMTIDVDTIGPVFSPILTVPDDPDSPPTGVARFDDSPTELRVRASDSLMPGGVKQLNNYTLRMADSRGLYMSQQSRDMSSFITDATFDTNTLELVLTLTPGLPDGSYKLAIHRGGTLTDSAGNKPMMDGFVSFLVGTPTAPPHNLGPVPLTASNVSKFPATGYTTVDVIDDHGTTWHEVIVNRNTTPVCQTCRINVSESESINGPDTNNVLLNGFPEPLIGAGINFGVDVGEDPEVLLTGSAVTFGDVDFYSFRARPGEVVHFELVDPNAFFGGGIPFSKLTIYDLGADNQIGGNGDNADRPIVTNADFFGGNFGFPGPVFLDFAFSGITGNALDEPENETLNPLGSERRVDTDRTYLLAVDTTFFATDYMVFGRMTESFTRATDQQQIIFIDWDGATNIPNNFSGLSQFVNIPAFNVQDFGLEPIFRDEFIDATMAEMREELERIRIQDINGNFSFELRDSLHYPDPGNRPNVTRVIIGGTDSLIGFSGFAFGIADSVDTGNQVGNNNVLVFSKSIADFRLGGQIPLGFGPDQIPTLAQDLADFVASHELGHVLGGWHTEDELEFVPDPLFPGFFTIQQAGIDNIMDATGIPDLDENVIHRFDHFVCFPFERLLDFFFNNDGVLDPFEDINGNGVFDCFGQEFFEGTADSIGNFAWGMEGLDVAPPRVTNVEVTPGQIRLEFSEGLDLSTLISDGNQPTITLVRAGFDNEFTNNRVPIQLQPVTTLGPSPDANDVCKGTVPTNVSVYDPCVPALILRVADQSQILLNDQYRLTLQSDSTLGVRDDAGNLLDGEINLPVSQRISPRGERFPSGNGTVGGSFVLDFLVTDRIGIDADFAGAVSAGTPGLLTNPPTPLPTIQAGLDVAQFAGLKQVPVTVQVSPSIFPYLALDPRLDPTPLTQSDQGSLIVPANVHLEFSSTANAIEAIFVATPFPDNPATPSNESASQPGTIYRVDASVAGAGRVLGSFAAPTPIPANAGLAFDGSSLYFVRHDALPDNSPYTIFVINPETGAVTNSFTATLPAPATGGRNVDGVAVSDTLIYLADAETNTVFRFDKQTGLAVDSFTVPFNLVGGLDYDAITDTLWASGLSSAGATEIHQLDPRLTPKTTRVLATFAAPPGATGVAGVGVSAGSVLLADTATDNIFVLDQVTPSASRSFVSPAPNPAALAGPPISQLVVKMLGTRIEASGEKSAIVAVGESIDNPIIFTSARDTSVMGTGVSNAAPGDWMGIAFRHKSDDFASLLENIAVHFGGGPGTVIPGLTQTLSPITLFDARPTIRNVEVSTNAEAAIAATPNSFERLLGRSGPDLFWEVDAGVPLAANWCIADDPATAAAECVGTEFGLFQTSTGKFFLDRNGNRILDDSEVPVEAFGQPGDTAVSGDFSDTTPTDASDDVDEIAVFDRRTGLWTIDLNGDLIVSLGIIDPGTGQSLPDDQIAIPFGLHADLPVVGDWGGTGVSKIGVFRERPRLTDAECLEAARLGASCFILDVNGNFQIDPGEDFLFGLLDDVPVVGNFDAISAGDEFGVYRGTTGEFLLDRNGNRVFDPGERDSNGNNLEDPQEAIGVPNGVLDINDGPIVFGPLNGTPVIGNWDPRTPGDEIGVVDSARRWLVDANGNLEQDPTEVAVSFGQVGDVPVPGEWAPTGAVTLINGGTGTFAIGTTSRAGSQPAAVAIGNFDGVNGADVVIANSGSDDVSVLLNDGTGEFGAPASFRVGSSPSAVAVADLNGDGDADLVVTNAGSNNVSVLLGDGAGGFGAAANFAVGQRPSGVAIADINGDTLQDIVVANSGANSVSVLLGNGAGGFGPATNIAVASSPSAVAVADLDGTAGIDIVVTNGGSGNVSVLLSNGAGGFGVPTNVAAGAGPAAIVAGNFDNQGGLDLAVANADSNNITVLRSTGLGTFQAATTITVGLRPTAVAAGDVNGDGRSDLVVANSGANTVSILFGNGAGGFIAQPVVRVNGLPIGVAVTGLDATAGLDVVVATSGESFGVFRPTVGQWFLDNDANRVLALSEDLDGDGNLDVDEDNNRNGRLDAGEDRDEDGRIDVREDVDPDGPAGPLQPNGVLDINDGGFEFSAALRNNILDFVFNNSLNAVWVKPGFQTVSDAHWNDVQIPHVLTGTIDVEALPQAGVVPTLEIEPGMVVKMGLANLSVGGFGSTLLIDSDLEIGEPRVVFTSLLDDARGPAGRPHDTNNDSGALTPLPGDWGGIVVNSGSSTIINGAEIQYAGNLRVPAVITDAFGFRQTALISPNPITLNQSNCGVEFSLVTFAFTTVCPPIFATITNNIIANTNSVQNTLNPRTRPSDVAAIGIVGASVLADGPNLPRIPFNANPFIRGNDVSINNGLNGLEIRTSEFLDPVTDPLTFANAFLFSEARMDDTDITHILLGTLHFLSDAITFPQPFDIQDVNTPLDFNGFTLTLASNPVGTYDDFDGTRDGKAESLVVKFGGRYSNRYSLASAFPGTVIVNSVFGTSLPLGAAINVGFDDGSVNTPFQNFPFDTGGDSAIVIEGVPGDTEQGIASTPVILTSIRDDTAGPKGVAEDTNNDSTTTLPARGDWEGVYVGAWARNFGRISPLNGESLGPSSVRDADIRYANNALFVQSQSIEITNSIIRDNTIGIRSLQGPNVPNTPMGLNPQGIPRDPSSPLVVNNIIVSNGTGYQQTGGGDSTNLLQESWPSRALVLHNTFDSNGTGASITQRSGPLVTNNAFTNNTGTGLVIDNSSLRLNLAPPEVALLHDPPVQVVRNLFFGNGNNGVTGTVPATVGGQEIIGVAPGYTSPGTPDYNYTPIPGSPLVDSALSEYGSRTEPAFGFVSAPERDKNGVFRRDHFGTPNVGVGSRPWLDIGAIELVDILSSFPRVVRMTPLPGTNFPNGFGPSLVELEFSEPVTNVGTTTFFVEASGGDNSFTEGNEIRIVGQVSAVSGSGGTRWNFTPTSGSGFNSFQNESLRVSAIGNGTQTIVSVATGDALDGEFFGTFPSGDGVEGGDFRATFTIGDVLGRALYVDDTTPACSGVPRTDPNLQLFTTITAALAAALPGDTILVCPGVYTGALNITVPVTIESLEGALPRKNAQGQLIVGTGTFITVTGGGPAITVNNVSTQFPTRIGSTRGGVNHGFVITTSPISGPVGGAPAGVGIDVFASIVDIEANIIISNTIGVRADSQGTARLPNITNNVIVGNTTGTSGGAGIDITSRNQAALATIINNTIAYNQAGILLREDGLDPQGRIVATVQNNVITSNSNTGLSTVSSRAVPNVFHNNAWGNGTPTQSSNFGGTLANISPSAFDLGGNPIPDAQCTPTTTICGNISVNPFFINPVDPRNVSDRAEFFRIANFELQSSSKLIDRGRDEDSPTRDFKGRTRVVDIPGVGNETSPPPPPAPDSDPRSVDIGAFEFTSSAVSASVGARSAALDAEMGDDSDSLKSKRGKIRLQIESLVGSGAWASATDDLLDQLSLQLGEMQLRKSQSQRLESLVDEFLDDVLAD